MNQLLAIITGIFVLIAIFLFLDKGDKTVNIISTLASNATSGIKTLQGRA